ncbi:MAG: radical SAM family heme chaperone HemW [Clostridia bacterium]|nr:radical SAM family heme chaperone HemW [Clostridia bacterium]
MELYVHIPYCRQKCRYCDFASYAGREATMARYVEAVLSEAASLPCDTWLTTAFLGGGTPSLLPPALLERLLQGLQAQYSFTPGMEFTSEANPGTLTEDWLRAATGSGVNRLSMGMQAFQPELLRTLGRIHTHDQVVDSVRMARRAGIGNLSLDLMFGLPGQTPAMWRETLYAALALEPQHLSCYGLIPEEGTPLKIDLDAGRLSLPDEDDERRMYDDTLDILARHGFVQYEISNFALPGYACQHNIGYWRQAPYIGLGASAASMQPRERDELRTSNPPDIMAYIDMTERADWAQREQTTVSAKDARFETLMLGLRMTEGVCESAFEQMHGVALQMLCGKVLHGFKARGLLDHQDGWWRLTRRGMDVQNAILVELLEEMEKDCPDD